MITPFKGRRVTHGMEVEVYRNLRNGLFSIRDVKSGLVIGHGDYFGLKDAFAIVSLSGQDKTKESGVRNVHAWFRGTLCYASWPKEKVRIVHYNPHHDSHFHCQGRPVKKAGYLYFAKEKCYLVERP